MSRTSVADIDGLVGDRVLAEGGAGIHSVDVVHAAAYGIALDDSDAHGDGGGGGGDCEGAHRGGRAPLLIRRARVVTTGPRGCDMSTRFPGDETSWSAKRRKRSGEVKSTNTTACVALKDA